MSLPRLHARSLAVLVALAAAACGDDDKSPAPGPYEGTPPLGEAIAWNGGEPIDGATGWSWVAFPDSICTNADLSTSTTGLAISWAPDQSNTDLVVFLQGGGACWDFVTCGGASSFGAKATANAGPFGPTEFAQDIYSRYPSSWVVRDNLPSALRGATIVFVPYCTGDVHAGDAVTKYDPPPELQGLPSITWHHKGHANVMAFLKRLGATFPNPAKVVVAGSSAGGFGALANYPAFRWYWPNAKSYLVDDSGPPLIGNAIPADTRAAWYASWNMGATLNPFCPECRTDMSAGMRNLEQRYPNDRKALLSHLQDATIRFFFGTYTVYPPSLTPMDATEFERQLRLLGDAMNATPRQRYFFTGGTGHPMLENPGVITSPSPGLTAWIQLMIADDEAWNSVAP